MQVDFHCHLFENMKKERLFDVFSLNFKGYGFFERIAREVDKIKSIETNNIIEKTIFHVRNSKIDKVVLLPISSKENEDVLKWKEYAPDVFIPFYNPPEKSIEGKKVSEIVEKAVMEHNYKGFKIMLSFRKNKLNDKIIYPTMEIAESKELPVLMHTGYPPPGTPKNVLSYSNPLAVDELMASFPNVKIILAHMGFPWTDIAIALAVQYPTIYLDISNMTYMMPYRLRELLLRAKDIIGTEKILFGTDGFIPEMIEVAMNFFNECDYLSSNEIENILGNNAIKILKLNMQ
ncbi:MAG: amidohydrolase family protein [Candidatus Lokiarchaeota archaeon]